MSMVNINTQSQNAPTRIGDTYPAPVEMLRENGWRDMPALPEIASGYERSAISYVEGDGVTATAVYSDTWIQTRLDAEAAAQAAAAAAFAASEIIRKNTPWIWDSPIEVPVLVFTSKDAGIGVAQAALDDGSVITFTYHASPIPDPAVIRQRFLDAKAAHDAAKALGASTKATATANIGAANSVPELRAAVLDLQAQINALEARIK